MIDTIPALAWCCLPDGANEFTNKQWRDYTGLLQAETLGLGWQRTFHPDDLGKVMENWRAVQASGEPSGAEARMRRFDGEYRWFLIRAEPVRDEHGNIVRWFGTSTDIEELKRAEKELRDLVDYIPQLIVILCQGRRESTSVAGAKMHQWGGRGNRGWASGRGSARETVCEVNRQRSMIGAELEQTNEFGVEALR
jgi:PAS domain S-box-containing protein